MSSDTYTKEGKQPDSNRELDNREDFTEEDQDIESSNFTESNEKVEDDTASSDKPNLENMASKASDLVEIESLKSRIKALEDDILREKAENQNARKRMLKEIASARDFGVEKLLKEFLPMKDSLDMGVANLDSDVEIESVKTGLRLTLKMADDFLKKMEIMEINPENQPFNPEEHQAMSVQESDSEPANTVLKVFQLGYKLKERLIRPAMVVVSAKKD